jgi:hypothetical protein
MPLNNGVPWKLIQTQTGDNVDYHSEQHFEAALSNRDAIIGFGDARTLIYLLLLAQHCLRVPKKMGAWYVLARRPELRVVLFTWYAGH